MNKADYPKDHPEYILFYGEKNVENEWYIINENEEKIWNPIKVTEFWTTLRTEKMAKEDYDFSEFIFPEFGEEHFWVRDKKRIFIGRVVFFLATFNSEANFTATIFEKGVDFGGSVFKGANFLNAIFKGEAFFGSSRFLKMANFQAYFKDKAFFRSTIFSQSVDFSSVVFKKEANFSTVSFTGVDFQVGLFKKKVDFRNAVFNEWIDFHGSVFKDRTDFEYAVFNGWIDFSSTIFKTWTNFSNAVFNRRADFSNASFEQEVYFQYCTFEYEVDFSFTIFNGYPDFSISTLKKYADFSDSSFKKDAQLSKVLFMAEVEFCRATFMEKVYFTNATFEKEAYFNNSVFNDELFFEEIYCIGNASLQFDNTKFPTEYPAHFKNIHFEPTVKIAPSKSKKSAKKPKVKQIPVVAFNRISFNEQVIFLNCDFTYMQFTDCELTQTTIGNCTFPRKEQRKFSGISVSSNRIQMGNEELTDSMLEQLEKLNDIEIQETEDVLKKLNENKDDEQKIEPKPDTLKSKNKQELKFEHYNMMAVTYRQLKTNRANNKDWTNAGDAYRSEMIMRRKIVWYEIIHNGKLVLFFNWMIIWLHDIFSGFQQSLSRPLFWLVMVWLGFGVGYFYHDGGVLGCCLQKSMYAILLLSGSLDKTDPLFGCMVFERMLGVILITFFVLATRARLKQ